jgi:large subunit ribosomal protein L6
MSRIGKRPIPIPDKVTVTIEGQHVNVKGPKGELSRTLVAEVVAEQDSGTLHVNRVNESRVARQRHGLSRSLVANMVEGVSQGFQKRLEIQGGLPCPSPRPQPRVERRLQPPCHY